MKEGHKYPLWPGFTVLCQTERNLNTTIAACLFYSKTCIKGPMLNQIINPCIPVLSNKIIMAVVDQRKPQLTKNNKKKNSWLWNLLSKYKKCKRQVHFRRNIYLLKKQSQGENNSYTGLGGAGRVARQKRRLEKSQTWKHILSSCP